MNQKAIIYLHGFNSASQNIEGNLLGNKQKLVVLQDFCLQKNIEFFAPNVDYRSFQDIVEDMLMQWNHFMDGGHDVVFMGSSMGGFASEYLAMKTAAKAIMINPVLTPTELLPQFIGVTENYEIATPYEWTQTHCNQYQTYETELRTCKQHIDITILLDREDELLDSEQTIIFFNDKANVVAYNGGSHSFEHIEQALPVIEQVIFDD